MHGDEKTILAEQGCKLNRLLMDFAVLKQRMQALDGRMSSLETDLLTFIKSISEKEASR